MLGASGRHILFLCRPSTAQDLSWIQEHAFVSKGA